MASRLRPCVACARHVRKTESVCPFCAAVLSDGETEPTGAALPSGVKITRAKVVFAASAAAIVAACTGGPGGPEPDNSSSGSSGSTSGTSGSSSSSGSSGSSTSSSGAPLPPYGVPPIDDGGTSGTAPAYGVPPIDGG